MQRAFNLRLISYAAFAALAFVAGAYAIVQHWVRDAGPLSMRACTNPSVTEAGNPHTVLFVNCGGFLQ